MDDDGHGKRVHAELIRQIVKLGPMGVIATLVNASLLVLVLWQPISHPLLIAWFSATMVLALLRCAFFYKYRANLLQPDHAARVRRWLVIGIGLSGIVWGSAAFFLFPIDSPTHQILVVFVLCGMVAGAAGTFSAILPVYMAFSLPTLVPLFIRFVLIGGTVHYAMGVMTLLYIVLTLIIARRLNFTTRELIEIKEQFAQNLEERTAELLHANERLQREVQERQRAEESSRHSAQQWQVTFDSIKDSVCLQATDGTILKCNKATLDFLQKPYDQIIGRKCYELMHKTNERIENCPVFRAVKSLRRETLILRLDSRHVEVVVDPILAEDGKLAGMVHILTDITARMETEKALRKSEEQYRSLFETMAQGVVYQDAQGHILSANPSAQKILGLSEEHILGSTSTDPRWKPIHEDGSEFPGNTHPAMVALKTGEAVHNVVMGVYNPLDHDYRWIRINAIPEFLPGEAKAFRVYTTLDDVTAEKRAEEERQKLEKHLQHARKMEVVANLAGGIAHQFNNALFGITGSIDLLEMELPAGVNVNRHTQPLKASVRRMTNLTAQLLAYAQGGKYQPRAASLNECIQETLFLIRQTMGSEIELTTNLSDEAVHVETDLTQMQMVLNSVLANAVEAIEGPGHIKIVTKNEEIDEEKARSFPGLRPGRYVCLTVEDTGQGMDEKTCARVFEPFFTTKFQGRGLSMAAVYGVIKNHEGWIGIDSQLGKGTTVRIYLPATQLPAREGEESRPAPAKRSGAILLVEDEEMVRNLSRAMMEKLGYRVIEAKTGQAAIDIVKNSSEEIEVAILDMGLPDMGGRLVYERIKEVSPHLKVVVCSGYAIDGPVQEVLDAGAQGFLQKPFSFANLSAKLKSLM